MHLPPASRPYAYVGFAALVAASLAGTREPAPREVTAPVVTKFDRTLTTYTANASSASQDLFPQALQRGSGIEGRVRARVTQGFNIAANPFEGAWSDESVNGIQLATGTYRIEDVDVALPADIPWVVGRTYNARQDNSGHRDSDGYQGKNWFQNSQPEIQLSEHATDDDKDVVYVYYGADRFAEYKRVYLVSGTSDEFQGTNGAAGVLAYTAGAGGEPDLYTLTDNAGRVTTFFGFDGNAGAAAGQVWKITDSAGNVAYVGHATTASSAISSGTNGSGYITTAYDSAGRRYSYTYTTLDSVSRLTEVKAEVNSGGWTTVGEVDYAYYSTSESHGEPGDLKLVTTTTPMTDAGISVTQKTYYRYWEGTFDDSTNPGHDHAIKFIVDAEGTRRQDWEDSTWDEDSSP